MSSGVFNIQCLPLAAILCDIAGGVVDWNSKAEKLVGISEGNQPIDNLIDFSKSDLTDCSRFLQVAAQIKQRSEDLNSVTLKIDTPRIHHLQISFSFLEAKGSDLIVLILQDVTERDKFVDTLRYKQSLLDNILNASQDAMVVFDEFGFIEVFSPAAERMFGKASTEMIIEDVFTLFSEEDRKRVRIIIEKLKGCDENSVHIFEDLTPVNGDGQSFPASITFSRSIKGDESVFSMMISDKSLFYNFVNSIDDAYLKTDDKGLIIDNNVRAEVIFGISTSDMLHRHLSFLRLVESDSGAFLDDVNKLTELDQDREFSLTTAAGDDVVLNINVWPQEVNGVRLNNLILRDISQKKITEKHLINSALTDALTGLANRASFSNKLYESIECAKAAAARFALLVVDLDKFKYINDNFGHDYGDELLKLSAERLKACVREHDLVARMGGDEFTVIVSMVEDPSTVGKIAERIIRAFRREFRVKEKRLLLSASVGAAIYPDDAVTYEEIYGAADLAMYTAKRSGKDAFKMYTRQLHAAQERLKCIEQGLKTAISENQLCLNFQPKVSYSQLKLVGFEALLRWHHPVLGHVSPMEFIPVSEETGSIVEISKWVIREAIRSVKCWQQQNTKGQVPEDLTVAVNISAEHFKFNLYEDIVKILTDEDFDPRRLELEITESMLLDYTSDAVDILRKLHELGVHISLDDFGTGYASLQYLKHFSLNTLKIDRSFVRDIHSEDHSLLIIESIISIANRLNLKLVAEGVETSADVMKLVDLGCDVFQGYFYSKPIPAQDVLGFLESWPENLVKLHKNNFPKTKKISR